MNKNDAKQLAQSRAQWYDFLSRVYLYEADEKQLAAIARLKPASGCKEFADSVAELASCAAKLGRGDVDDLAADYARTFLSAGVATGIAAFPYESVYTDRQRGKAAAGAPNIAVEKCYAAHGVEANEKGFHVPADHLGLETAFMASLCRESAEALDKGDEKSYREKGAEQEQFWTEHLGRWVMPFRHDLEKYALTPYYKAVAKVTGSFMKMEKEMLENAESAGGEAVWAIN
jgi:anaerobic sulfite reductase subunit A